MSGRVWDVRFDLFQGIDAFVIQATENEYQSIMERVPIDSIQGSLLAWASRCSFSIGSYFDLCKPFFIDTPRIDPKLQFVLYQLATSCHLTSESALILISSKRLWDAEVLVRAVIEGTFKFIFLCVGDEEERKNKVKEYWDDLPEVTRIKRHQRLEEFLSKVDDQNADEWKPFRDLLIPSAELDLLKTKYPRKTRQQLEQKWSFNEIAGALSKVDIAGFENLKSMSFSYGMASHLVHQDADAIGIIWDRHRREDDRRASVEVAHGARELSDIVSMAMFRTLMLFKLDKLKTDPVHELLRSHQALMDELSEVQGVWHRIEYDSAKH